MPAKYSDIPISDCFACRGICAQTLTKQPSGQRNKHRQQFCPYFTRRLLRASFFCFRMTDDEKLPILGSNPKLGSRQLQSGNDPVETNVYKRRWWVLGIFVLTSCTQVFGLFGELL